MLFPSKDQRDWNKWVEEQKPKVPKFKIGQLVRSKRSGNIYEIIDNSDIYNYCLKEISRPLPEYDLEDATPKTWDELKKLSIYDSCILKESIGSIASTNIDNTPIEKSAIALLKICQLIKVGYGSNVTKEEWETLEDIYVIEYYPYDDEIKIVKHSSLKAFSHIAFHNKEQAVEFLSYIENENLIKDYFMI